MMHFSKLAGATLLAAALMIGAAAAQTGLRSADTHPGGHPTPQERTGGGYSVEVYHSAQLGQEADTIEQVRSGVIDLNRVSMAPWNSLVPLTKIPSLPYLFTSPDHARKVMAGEIGDEIAKGFDEHGVVVIAFYDGGARSFYNSKKAVNTVDDLKGMKYRVIQSDVFVDMVAALGATATPMPYGEVYSSIETGVIDGAENNFPSYESAKHFEVAKFYSLDEHTIVPEVFVMAKTAWDRLSDEDKAIFKQAGKESMEKQWQLWDERVAASRKIVEDAGSQINTPEKQPFIDAMAPVYGKYVNTPELKAFVERIRAVK